MRLVMARADKLAGLWEVNRNISVGEQFGQVLGWRLSTFRPSLTTQPPYKILPPDTSAIGRMAIHQGGIVDTPRGEWWGVSMGEENAIGRVTTLSPITWQDGWPYFGLPGNLGRSPRIWVKPDTGRIEKPHAPYVRSDDFSKPRLQPVWQWNHVPVDTAWSLTERPGYLRLHALPADDIWYARNTLTQRAVGPRSIPTALMDASELKPGDVAGFALLIQPDAWVGVERSSDGLTLIQHDGQTMQDQRVHMPGSRVWLRADCDYTTQIAQFSYSFDGQTFHNIGEPFRMVGIGVTFQGVRYALFSFHHGAGGTGFADFDSIEINEPNPHGITRSIPYGKQIELSTTAHQLPFTVVDQGLGRVALRSAKGFLSVATDGSVSVRPGKPGSAETFQWIETFTGDLTLMSLTTHRYLRLDFNTGALSADSPGPEPNGPDGVRFTGSDRHLAVPGSQFRRTHDP
jgi:xylan 1,4-beta-xylosidase